MRCALVTGVQTCALPIYRRVIPIFFAITPVRMIQCSQTEAPPDHSRGACESDRRSNPCSSPENAKRAPVPGWVPGEPGVTGDAGPAAEAAGGISKCRCVRRITRIERSTADARPLGPFDIYVHPRPEEH